MGFKTNNYESKAYGITIPEAYARVTRISVNVDGKADARFEIQQNRESVGSKASLEIVPFRCEIDKDLPIYEQVYLKAKEEYFSTWQDDIVEKVDINE